MKKRYLVLLLAILIAAALPLLASAETQSGDCGDGVTWTLTDSGVLTVSGAGNMTYHPWDHNLIKQVVIENGVTGLCDWAFSECGSLTKLTIADSVTSIGTGTFIACPGLTRLQLPAGLTAIGEDAFWGCSGLTSVTIPASVQAAGGFGGCTGLKTLTIKNGVASIDRYGFAGCTGLTMLTIPSSVTEIGDGAFWNCSGLTSVSIPSSITDIPEWTFGDCASLKSITIPGTVQSIGGSAFEGCKALTGVTIPGHVKTLGHRVFAGCANLKSITIPASVEGIEDEAFADCNAALKIRCAPESSAFWYAADNNIPVVVSGPCGDSLTFTLEDGVLTISGKGAMYDYDWENNHAPWGGVTKIVIGNGVTHIGQDAFTECGAPAQVTIGTGVKTIGKQAFWGCPLTSVILPDSVTDIGERAFVDCGSLKTVTFGSKVKTIGREAFWLDGLTSVTIPDSVTDIGERAFLNCDNLKTVTIGNGVKTIGKEAFAGNPNLTAVTMGNGVTTIGQSAFQFDGALTGIELPDTVTSIGEAAFANCDSLASVSLSKKLTKISNGAFHSCGSLKSVTIPSGVTEIEQVAFFDCISLQSITLPKSLVTFGDDIFATENLTIYCYADSKAQEYAAAHEINTKLLDAAKPVISAQPANLKANEGKAAVFKVAADGAESYQWYYRSSAKDAWKAISTGGTAATLRFTAKAAQTGRQFRCLVKNGAGNVYSKIVTLTVNPLAVITKQPVSAKVNEDSKATFKVTATGATGYQWYCRQAAGASWQKISKATSATYSFTVKAANNGYEYRCIVKNSAGDVYTDAVKLTVNPKPVISAQPEDTTVNEGEKATFKVTASGAESYQWFYRKNAKATWQKASGDAATKAAFTFTAKAAHKGYQYRCLLKNAAGSVYSGVVTLAVNPKPTITKQPANATVNEGGNVTFKVTAKAAVSYQWYSRKSAKASWQKINDEAAAKAAFTFTANASDKGYQFRCLVKNDVGFVYSDAVTLTVNLLPVITKQPVNTNADDGQKVTFKVTASGAKSYQWFYRKNAKSIWTKVTDATAASYSFTAKTAFNGREYRCLIKNSAGSVYTNSVALTINPKPVITGQPVSAQVSDGGNATFRVAAEGASSYQWYSRKNASGTWAKVTDATSDTYSFTAKAANSGRQFRCLVKNDAGSVYSDTVTLTVK